MCRLTAILIASTFALLPAGCQREGTTLESFKEQWYAAVNRREPEALYQLLDARSRRSLDEKLETLRGFDKEQQQVVINYLGGDRVGDLHQLSNERFFALWWRRVTDDQPPTMAIEAAGTQAAYMVIALKGQSQRIELKQEGGRWVWVLPTQRLQLPDPPAHADAKAPAPAKP